MDFRTSGGALRVILQTQDHGARRLRMVMSERSIKRKMGPRDQNQLESQLLAEWRATLPPYFKIKTQVHVGAVPLVYRGEVLTPARRRAFAVWNDWMDARIFTGTEIWCVEACIVGKAGKYGQAMSYASEWPQSLDAKGFSYIDVVPVVLCAFEKPDTSGFFSRFRVRTILFTPAWAGVSLATKVHQEVITNPTPG